MADGRSGAPKSPPCRRPRSTPTCGWSARRRVPPTEADRRCPPGRDRGWVRRPAKERRSVPALDSTTGPAHGRRRRIVQARRPRIPRGSIGLRRGLALRLALRCRIANARFTSRPTCRRNRQVIPTRRRRDLTRCRRPRHRGRPRGYRRIGPARSRKVHRRFRERIARLRHRSGRMISTVCRMARMGVPIAVRRLKIARLSRRVRFHRRGPCQRHARCRQRSRSRRRELRMLHEPSRIPPPCRRPRHLSTPERGVRTTASARRRGGMSTALSSLPARILRILDQHRSCGRLRYRARRHRRSSHRSSHRSSRRSGPRHRPRVRLNAPRNRRIAIRGTGGNRSGQALPRRCRGLTGRVFGPLPPALLQCKAQLGLSTRKLHTG